MVNALTRAIFGGIGVALAIAFGGDDIDTAGRWWNKYLSHSEGGGLGSAP